MKVALAGHFGAGYSGGRIHAWLIASALSSLGHEVTIYCNAKPGFVDEFQEFYPYSSAIRYVVEPTYMFDIAPEHDVLFLIPDLVGNWELYHSVINHVRTSSCVFALINYETPNWKQLEHDFERLYYKEYGAFEASRHAKLVLSNSPLSSQMAKEYFTESPALFRHVCPPIHTMVADRVAEPKQKENRIIVISRFKPRYKNLHRFVEILSPACAGYQFVLIENGMLDRQTLGLFSRACDMVGATFTHVKSVSEVEKFELIKSSKLMVYPSTFEGYGLPPVEALYCGVPCLAFELPVLKGVHGDNLIYAAKGDFAHMREQLKVLLTARDLPVSGKELHCQPHFSDFAAGLDAVMKEVC